MFDNIMYGDLFCTGKNWKKRNAAMHGRMIVEHVNILRAYPQSISISLNFLKTSFRVSLLLYNLCCMNYPPIHDCKIEIRRKK